jgi:hypothetical protein
MSESKKKHWEEIDYVFPRYELWVRYSGLPKTIGVVAWAVFQRLLELRHRFNSVKTRSAKFHYSIEKLCQTTGVSGRGALRRVIKRLCDAELIRYKPTHGRGQEAEFEIIEPIKTPIPEEEIYRNQPRLRSKSYNRRLREELKTQENGSEGSVSEEVEKNGSEGSLLEDENGSEGSLLEDENGSEGSLLEGKTDPRDPPLKKIYIKRQQQQKDLFHEKDDQLQNAGPNQNQVGTDVVVAFNAENLKEYGIAGEQAEKYVKRYSESYLKEKIEIVEYKRFCGEKIRNIGGMLRKAIEEDWRPPEGFETRAQREEAARKKKETEEAAAREAKEKAEQERREREKAEAAEEWKKTAAAEELKKIHERAGREVMAEYPKVEESLLRTPIRLRENKIIAEEYLREDNKKAAPEESKRSEQQETQRSSEDEWFNDEEKKPPEKKKMKVNLWLRVENNNKFVRGRKKALTNIERYILSQYDMRKPKKDGWEYELTIPYENDTDLEETIDEMIAEIEREADARNCFIEADVSDPDSDRTW